MGQQITNTHSHQMQGSNLSSRGPLRREAGYDRQMDVEGCRQNKETDERTKERVGVNLLDYPHSSSFISLFKTEYDVLAIKILSFIYSFPAPIFLYISPLSQLPRSWGPHVILTPTYPPPSHFAPFICFSPAPSFPVPLPLSSLLHSSTASAPCSCARQAALPPLLPLSAESCTQQRITGGRALLSLTTCALLYFLHPRSGAEDNKAQRWALIWGGGRQGARHLPPHQPRSPLFSRHQSSSGDWGAAAADPERVMTGFTFLPPSAMVRWRCSSSVATVHPSLLSPLPTEKAYFTPNL
jgi:hypothetical protein